MGVLSNVLESVFPAMRLQRIELEERAVVTRALTKALTQEISQDLGVTSSQNLEESMQFLGTPWQAEAAQYLPSEAWKRGFPWGSLGSVQTAEQVVNSDALRKQTLAFARQCYYKNPHARAVINTIVYFICGSSGWKVQPLPKNIDDNINNVQPVFESAAAAEDTIRPVGNRIAPVQDIPTLGIRPPKAYNPELEPQINKGLQGLLERAWSRFCELGNVYPTMSDFQLWWQFVMRLFRDGEVFLHLGHRKADKQLAPRFLEPEDISTPDGACQDPDDPKSTGIETDEDDDATIVRFWYKPHKKLKASAHTPIDAREVIYARWDWDSGLKRGLPALFCVFEQLGDFERWMRQSMRNQRIQGQVAVLRQWQNTDMAAVAAAAKARTWVNANVQTPAGKNIEYNATEMGPIIDAPAGMQMSAFAPRSNAGESEILVRRVLLAIAAGLGLSEAMVTADGSNGSYSSTRITQFTAMRMFEAFQKYIGDMKKKFYKRWLATEINQNRIPRTNDSEYDCNVQEAPLPNFEAETIVGAVVQMLNGSQTGGPIISNETAQEMLRVDPKVEKARLKEQTEEQMKLQQKAAEQQAAAQAVANAQAIAQTMPVENPNTQLEPELETQGA